MGVMREGGDTFAVEWVRTRPLCERPGSDPTCRYREDPFATATMPIAMDATQVAWYDFDTDVGGVGRRPGVADNQQGDTQDDTQLPDNRQTDGGETPEELPDTGAGGLVAHPPLRLGNVASVAVLLSTCFAILRRR